MKDLGFGKDYKYAHDYPNAWVKMQFLPDEIKDTKLYELSDIAYEKQLKQYQEQIKK